MIKKPSSDRRFRCRHTDQLQGVEEVSLVVSRDQHIDGVDPGVPIEIVGKVDRRRVHERPLVVPGAQHIEGVYLRVGRRVARFADGVAEVEDIGLARPVAAVATERLLAAVVSGLRWPKHGVGLMGRREGNTLLPCHHTGPLFIPLGWVG